MAQQHAKRMGRPPGSEFPHLIHIRLSNEMAEALEGIADERLDRPTMTALVREAIAHYVDSFRRERRRLK